jgi:predicted Zn-dependent protease
MALNLYPGDMSAPMPLSDEDGNAALEAVELMLALEAQNVAQNGFEESVRAAAASVNGEMLFHVPAPASLPFQRAALIMMPVESGKSVVLAVLDEAGSAIELVGESSDTAHLYRLGEAYLEVATRFRM